MSISFDDHKIGHLRVDRQLKGGLVITTHTLALRLSRTNAPLSLDTSNEEVEMLDGRVVSFSSKTALSSSETAVRAQREANGRYALTKVTGDHIEHQTMWWPREALLAEGQRRAMLAAGPVPGAHYRFQAFDPATQQTSSVAGTVLGDEWISLPEGAKRLSHQSQTITRRGERETQELWIDGQGRVLKQRMTLLRRPVELLACSRGCALAPDHPVDLFRLALVPSPHALDPSWRTRPLRYRVRLADASVLPVATSEQHVTSLGDGRWLVEIDPTAPYTESSPQPTDRMANRWVDSDAPAVQRLMEQARELRVGDDVRMAHLRALVRRHLRPAAQDASYASASEALLSGQGDCTEYAVVLAALARAMGIPARVVSGLVYRERYGRAEHVFVPHAWVQAWVDGHWRSYDAALGRFDSGHVALAIGDGDPGDFGAANKAFGALAIEDVSTQP